jgi:glucose dehydrogenase
MDQSSNGLKNGKNEDNQSQFDMSVSKRLSISTQNDQGSDTRQSKELAIYVPSCNHSHEKTHVIKPKMSYAALRYLAIKIPQKKEQQSKHKHDNQNQNIFRNHQN